MLFRSHTHGLLITDLFSLYLTFFPLKSKSSEQVATALRSFFSFQGIPQVVYSDNDTAFQKDVLTLFATHNIQHVTSYPYSQRQNTVEAQVRRFKNAYRAALLSNPIFNSSHWHIIYPLVIIRLNTLISKYEIGRAHV